MIWGTGNLGRICIAECARHDEFRLVGVRTYSSVKDGIDSGVLAGGAPNGVQATCDVAALLGCPSECVIYVARESGGFETGEEILSLLRSGRNVVTPLPYHDPALHPDPSFGQRLAAACREGGATFHATGVNPSIVAGSILRSMLPLCTAVRSVHLRELWNCSTLDDASLAVYGFGAPEAVVRNSTASIDSSLPFLKIVSAVIGRMLGVQKSRPVFERRLELAASIARFQAGTVVAMTHRLLSFRESGDRDPFIVVESCWTALETLVPAGMQAGENWAIAVDGRPSLRAGLGLSLSGSSIAAVGETVRADDLSTVAACFNAIPQVLRAPPGVLANENPLRAVAQ